jgi:hypothetical protein
MRRWLLSVNYLVAVAIGLSSVGINSAAEKTAAERGFEALQRSLNPAVWSLKAYENAWKQWGLKAKPTNYEQAFRERYGLQSAPFDNKGRPLGLLEARSLLLVGPSNFAGKGIVNNCLLCHAGTVAGQTIIGAANSTLDLQSLFEDLSRTDGFPMSFPFQFSYVRGTVDPVNPLSFLLQFRDPDLNMLPKPVKYSYSQNICSDPPAWWLIKKKKTRDWTGGIDARSTRVDMVNLLSPLNSGDYVKSQASTFADISAFLLTVEAPKYPFPIDREQAAHGQGLFQENCAKCHGTYGKNWTYPDKVVPLGIIGTDRLLAESLNPRLADYLKKSWLAQELGPDGKPYQFYENLGYQAPPLDGIWATAPYFHNSSVPTVYHALNSKARPKVYTRTYRTDKEDYDPVRLGLKFAELDKPVDWKLSSYEQRKIYDTTQPGRSNAGHTFGDKLTEDERMAVIEYLKTL